MLISTVLILISTVWSTFTASAFSPCSKGCNCSETNVAVCNTLNLEPFNVHIFSLKIVHPDVPLILNDKPFLVRGLEDVNSILIENATILEIDQSAFIGVPLLNSLTISNSNIPNIRNIYAFQNTTGLKTLKITNSTLKSFESVKSESIEELELSGCELLELRENSFENLPLLTYVNVENNHISKIHPNTFSNLKYLQDVNLAHNNISSLDQRLFENNTDLVSLDLSNNPLQKLDIKIESELEKLVIKSCQLEEFDEHLRNSLNLLSYLDLSHNKINFPKDTFIKMEELEYINLSNNNLTFLEPKIFRKNYKLQKIILDNNNFKIMPKFECDAGHFDTYYFSCINCSLISVTVDSFKSFPALVILDLSNNHLTGNSLMSIRSLKTLIELDLSHNNLSFINPFAFINSTALEKINLSGNPLTTLDVNVFVNNKVLKDIDVSFCTLKQLWRQPVKIDIPSLNQLNIANNSISLITPTDLRVIPAIKVLDVSGNPLNCDQTLRDSIVWLNEHEVSPASASLIWKTKESMNSGDVTKFEYLSTDLPDWKELAKQRCPIDYYIEHYERVNEKVDNSITSDEYDEDYDYYFNEDEDEEDESSKDDDDNTSPQDEKDKNEQFEDEDSGIDISELAIESIKLRSRNSSHYSILWPTLVFIFTALSVLVIVANIMLLILRTRMIPRHVNLPHIKIPQWSSAGKLKKHSGSVYQPLSEDRSESYTPIITRKEPASIHNYSPKSAV